MDNMYHGASDTRIIWTPASDGDIYTNHRLPGIVVTKKDTVIIYCEARDCYDMVGSAGHNGDWCRMDVYVQRSEDGGDTFGEPIYISRGGCAEDGNGEHITIDNPVIIVGNDNTLHLLYSRDCCICGGGLWYTRSLDDGKTWSKPREITEYARADIGYDFDFCLFGPTHGICTSKNILMVTAWAASGVEGKPQYIHTPSTIHVFYSEDNGETWHATKRIGKNGNEGNIAELADGSIMVNFRAEGMGTRGVNVCRNFTTDKEPVWMGTWYPEALADPGCSGGMVAVNIEGLPKALLTVNCDSPSFRKNITVKCSFDGGITYFKSLRITNNYGGYSDIAHDSKGRIYVLWEASFGSIVSLTRFSFADEFGQE